jgi:hypothetical protein
VKNPNRIPSFGDCAINGATPLAGDQPPEFDGLKELWTLKWHKKYDINGPWTIAGSVQTSDWPQWMRHFKDY